MNLCDYHVDCGDLDQFSLVVKSPNASCVWIQSQPRKTLSLAAAVLSSLWA